MKKNSTTHPKNPRTHTVRIIGGQWKRTPLPVPDGLGLRPTPDRVRETIFNWLHHLLDGRWQQTTVLDLFAGSGALGMEAASRGAARVILVENNGAAASQLQTNIEKLHAANVSVVRGDALAVAQKMLSSTTSAGFQLIFADPPYHHDWLAKILPLCEKLLTSDGYLYVESEQPLIEDKFSAELADWQIVRADNAGQVHFHLLQRKSRLPIEA